MVNLKNKGLRNLYMKFILNSDKFPLYSLHKSKKYGIIIKDKVENQLII